MCTECHPAQILNHESEVGISVRDAVLYDECPIEKGLTVQLLRLSCDELLGIVGSRHSCMGVRTCSLSLLQDSFLQSDEGIEMVKI